MGSLTGSANFIKYLLFLVNFFLVITGIIILSVGATVQGVYHGFQHFLDGQYFTLPALLISIGIIIFIVAFFGCCGAFKENYCMVITFSVLMIAVFILEFSAGIAGYALRNDARSMLENNLNHTMSQYNNASLEYIHVLWDKVQREFDCCGINKPDDWLDPAGGIPMSCCEIKSGTIGTVNCTITEAHQTGCLDYLTDFIKSHAVSLGAAGVVLALIQLIGIFFTCYIAKRIKQTSSHSTF